MKKGKEYTIEGEIVFNVDGKDLYANLIITADKEGFEDIQKDPLNKDYFKEFTKKKVIVKYVHFWVYLTKFKEYEDRIEKIEYKQPVAFIKEGAFPNTFEMISYKMDWGFMHPVKARYTWGKRFSLLDYRSLYCYRDILCSD